MSFQMPHFCPIITSWAGPFLSNHVPLLKSSVLTQFETPAYSPWDVADLQSNTNWPSLFLYEGILEAHVNPLYVEYGVSLGI